MGEFFFMRRLCIYILVFQICYLFGQENYRSVDDVKNEWSEYTNYQRDEMLSFIDFLFNEEYYDYFSGTLIGATPQASKRKINFSLGNVLQAKYLNDSNEQKVNLFSWRINTGYNLNNEKYKLSNLNSSIRSSLKNT